MPINWKQLAKKAGKVGNLLAEKGAKFVDSTLTKTIEKLEDNNEQRLQQEETKE